ncbi:hypothetical protein EB796_004293 [Bugula neritina]|uniref:Uncharacterized protein n=1 Tax=Bugula neritina TaxID=10212 RepID=A0A7J7KFI0_BUGNE|nr:hypothetical protein EB796_004293 [Bugula neritina]
MWNLYALKFHNNISKILTSFKLADIRKIKTLLFCKKIHLATIFETKFKQFILSLVYYSVCIETYQHWSIETNSYLCLISIVGHPAIAVEDGKFPVASSARRCLSPKPAS